MQKDRCPSLYDLLAVFKWWKREQRDVAHHLLPLLLWGSGAIEQCERAAEHLCLILDRVLCVRENHCTPSRMTPYAFREAWGHYYHTPPLCITPKLAPSYVKGTLGLLLVLRPIDQTLRFDNKTRGTILNVIRSIDANPDHNSLFSHAKSTTADLRFLVTVSYVPSTSQESPCEMATRRVLGID